MQRKSVTQPTYIYSVKDLGRSGDSGKYVSRPTTVLTNGMKQSNVSVANCVLVSILSEREGSRYFKPCLNKQARRYSNISLRRANINYTLTPGADPILELGSYQVAAKYACFPPAKAQLCTLFFTSPVI